MPKKRQWEWLKVWEVSHKRKPGKSKTREEERMLDKSLCSGRDGIQMEAVNIFSLFLLRQGEKSHAKAEVWGINIRKIKK